MHLKPQSMQDITPLLKKEKVHYYIILPSPMSLCPKALIVFPQQMHLMLYLNIKKI